MLGFRANTEPGTGARSCAGSQARVLGSPRPRRCVPDGAGERIVQMTRPSASSSRKCTGLARKTASRAEEGAKDCWWFILAAGCGATRDRPATGGDPSRAVRTGRVVVERSHLTQGKAERAVGPGGRRFGGEASERAEMAGEIALIPEAGRYASAGGCPSVSMAGGGYRTTGWSGEATASTHPQARPTAAATEHSGRWQLPCRVRVGTGTLYASPAELEAATRAIPRPVRQVWVRGR